MSRPWVHTAHGTYSRYRKGCRCVECLAVSRARASGGDRATGRLLVECWCHSDELLVEPRVVKAGLSASCGRSGCDRKELAG